MRILCSWLGGGQPLGEAEGEGVDADGLGLLGLGVEEALGDELGLLGLGVETLELELELLGLGVNALGDEPNELELTVLAGLGTGIAVDVLQWQSQSHVVLLMVRPGSPSP